MGSLGQSDPPRMRPARAIGRKGPLGLRRSGASGNGTMMRPPSGGATAHLFVDMRDHGPGLAVLVPVRAHALLRALPDFPVRDPPGRALRMRKSASPAREVDAVAGGRNGVVRGGRL